MSTPPKRNSQHVYDYAIIGSGLSGLCVATALNKISSNTILLDGGDTFGGFNRSIPTPLGAMNNGLRFFPETELSHKAVAFLEMLLMNSLSAEPVENQPLTYESGTMKPFVGFGSHPPAFYEELSYFTNPRSLSLKLEPHEWTQILFNNYSGDFSPRSYVTKFHGEGGRIQQLTVNGQKKINVQNVIYCGPIKALAQLLPEDALSHKARGKVSKNQYWTAVCLDLMHSRNVTENTSMHVLNGTTQDDLGPCVGRFYPGTTLPVGDAEETLQYSQWMTFVDAEESEDTEVIGAALKKVKRQIKRAFPEALEKLKYERILVVPEYAGNGDLRLNANQSLPNYENFWVGSPTISSQKSVIGALLQAELVSAALGCHPLGVQVDVEAPQVETDPLEETAP
jgi:hypothetical protein